MEVVDAWRVRQYAIINVIGAARRRLKQIPSQYRMHEMQRDRALAAANAPSFTILGVRVLNVGRAEAVSRVERLIGRGNGMAAGVYFVNAHTLNLAASDPSFRDVLNGGDLVFADGTGVRWAARLRGIRLVENLNGTDFVPAFFQATADRGYSCYLLGADETTIGRAAEYARRTFPGWIIRGHHHGYLREADVEAAALQKIRDAKPDVLLVGMGNPRQERWIERHRAALGPTVCLGVGGLFDFWAGNVRRAPAWLRRAGHEWLWRLLQQPGDKARRYLCGNPQFLARVLRECKKSM